jgi:hypothetical protein
LPSHILLPSFAGAKKGTGSTSEWWLSLFCARRGFGRRVAGAPIALQTGPVALLLCPARSRSRSLSKSTGNSHHHPFDMQWGKGVCLGRLQGGRVQCVGRSLREAQASREFWSRGEGACLGTTRVGGVKWPVQRHPSHALLRWTRGSSRMRKARVLATTGCLDSLGAAG